MERGRTSGELCSRGAYLDILLQGLELLKTSLLMPEWGKQLRARDELSRAPSVKGGA